MPRPLDEKSRVGAVLRDPACHLCGHPHHVLPCGDGCDCDHDIQPGVD